MQSVLFIGNFLSASRGTIGPTENLAKHLRQEGVRTRLCSTQENKIFRALDIVCSMLFSSCDLVCVDVFSGNVLRLLPIISPLAALRKKPMVFVLHGGQLPEIYERNKIAVKKVFLKASALVTPSLYLKDYFEGKGFAVQYLPNAVSLEKFPYAQPLQILDAPKLLWVRAFSSIYNPALAIETLGALKQTYPAATLTMVGPDAGLLSHMKVLISEKGLSGAVHIVGSVPNDQLGVYYRTHSIFINTTAYESFGVAVLEAAASGIPIVSLSVGNLPFMWVHEQEIALVGEPTATAMAAQITTICADPTLARNRSQQARIKAEQYTINAILPQWRHLINGLLGQ